MCSHSNNSNSTGVSGKYIKTIIILFCLGWAVIYADRTALYPMLSIIGKEFDLTNTQMGIITSSYFFAYVAVQIPVGVMGDRIGLKKVLVVFFLIAGLGMALVGLMAASYLTLIAFVALHGIGAGGYYPTAYGITLSTVPKERRGISSALINVGMSLGLILGLISSGPLFEAAQNWRFPFLTLAVPTILVGICMQLFLKDTGSSSGTQTRFLEIIKDKNLMLLNLCNFCVIYGFWVALTWGPTFFVEERGLGLTLAGIFTAIPAISSIPFSLILARISDRIGRKKVTLAILPISALMIFSMAYVKSTTTLILVLLGYGTVGKLTFDPIFVSWYGDRVSATKPDLMGSALGLSTFVGMSSAVVAPVVSGLIKDITGSLEGAFYLGSFIVLLGLVFAVQVGETVKIKQCID
ncbi:MAG: MFS transporter [Clostridia bacterium]|nr:MFS transporter [Clostridia bacterium]